MIKFKNSALKCLFVLSRLYNTDHVRSMREGNVFTGVCLFVYEGG